MDKSMCRIVLLASLFACVFLISTASGAGLGKSIKGGRQNNNDTIKEYDEDYLMYDDDYGDTVKESKLAGKQRCSASSKCLLFGGFCVKSRKDCDGLMDARGCKGRKCKCCIPGPPCSPTTDDPVIPDTTTTTPDTTTTTEANTGTCSFEDFNGRSIRRTLKSDTLYDSYAAAMSFCYQCGSTPFIPRTEADYQLYRDVRNSLEREGSMWLPGNDIEEEETLVWYNGDVATDIEVRRWDWPGANNELLFTRNSQGAHCLYYGTGYNGGPVYVVLMMLCEKAFDSYPPICEKI